ncbi:general secretion pathway protein M|uniref:Type II secretion system protein M n=1 Tax=Brenneria salicis ATCC 15712 = DSM 30166 TaxID=714314 RepID=A0A366I979_9GAMM|nr:type II secretion system protein M [Brenneria salicis]NMN91007.1 general secretion pathway protein M [Brenneria salicis ATCC 15712 = DSM 30166]RBP66501.1 general secretion pathway protein M [Brenneria salicis ATCC 15712 = DSM 30166]RLM32047.1 type II secretion protein M [Brenneria salicis ATCC 15712 = DSM 30166]
MNELLQRWRAMNPRERQLLLVCAGMLLLCLGYYAIWQPWQNREHQWQRIISREQQTVEWIQKQAVNLPGDGQAQEDVQGRDISLPILVSQSTGRYGLTVVRLQPQGSQIMVALERSDFNTLIRWLSELEQKNGVRVLALDVAAVDQSPGSVDITRLLLARPDEE